MNKMKNFKRRFSLSVPRTETIEESLTEFTEQFNQLNNQRNEGEELPGSCSETRTHSGPSGVGENLSSPSPSHPRGMWKGPAPRSESFSPLSARGGE